MYNTISEGWRIRENIPGGVADPSEREVELLSMRRRHGVCWKGVILDKTHTGGLRRREHIQEDGEDPVEMEVDMEMAVSHKLIACRKRIKEERVRVLEYLENKKHQEKDLNMEDSLLLF